jgi:hypothetical protein
VTTGSTSIDTRVYTVFPWTNCTGSGQFEGAIGWLTTKSWGGADWHPDRPPKGIRYRDRDHPYQGRYSAYGQQWAPRRSKMEDHAYSMVGQRKFNGIASWTGPMGACAPGVDVKYSSGFEEAFGTAGPVQKWTSNDFLRLCEKLRESIAGSTFNLAVAAAEAAQSLTMIATAAVKLNNAYRSCRRGNLVGAWHGLTGHRPAAGRRVQLEEGERRARATLNSADTIARNWLELQYGWKPLLSDVFDACQSLAHFLNTPLQRSYRVSRSVKGFAVAGYFHGEYETQKVYTRVGLIARVKEASIPQLLGLTDPASLVWEKLPFSFVADWFLPIGSWLSSRGLASSLDATFVISRKVYYFVKGLKMKDSAPPGLFPGLQTEYSDESTAFSREVTNDLDIPFPLLVPLEKWGTWQHAANAVALLVSGNSSTGSSYRK